MIDIIPGEIVDGNKRYLTLTYEDVVVKERIPLHIWNMKHAGKKQEMIAIFALHLISRFRKASGLKCPLRITAFQSNAKATIDQNEKACVLVAEKM